MQHLQPNTTLQGGKYQIIHFLSSGGFGNTYEGVHTMMDTRVAIKEFFPKMFCNRDENTSHVTVATQGNRELVDKLRKKFNEEAKAVFQMNHPNIVRVLDIFEENSTAYYVMEYIDGKSLNDITKERGALPETEAVGYIHQVADALKYVHSLNRLHLDIKPGNIMVDKNGKAILIDFGASKHYDDESGENTSTLMGLNTKGYAPIEQSTQSFTSFSPATDIYALGATLYKLLTGTVPPDANLLLAEEDTLQPLPTSISALTRDAVMAAMQLRRKDRPHSIDKLIEILSSIDDCISKKREGTTTTNKKPSSKKDEETLFDCENKYSNDVQKLQELTNAPITLCSTYLKNKKGDFEAALLSLKVRLLFDKYGDNKLGITKKICLKQLQYAEGSLEEARRVLNKLKTKREEDVNTLLANLITFDVTNIDLDTCRRCYVESKFDIYVAQEKLLEKNIEQQICNDAQRLYKKYGKYVSLETCEEILSEEKGNFVIAEQRVAKLYRNKKNKSANNNWFVSCWTFIKNVFCTIFYSCFIAEVGMVIGISLGFILGGGTESMLNAYPLYLVGIPTILGFVCGLIYFIRNYWVK